MLGRSDVSHACIAQSTIRAQYSSLFKSFLRLNIGSTRQWRLLDQLYLVFMCSRCGSLRYARKGQKTALCFKCGYRMTGDPFKIRILFKTARIEEARAALEKYKMNRGKKRLRPA